MIPGNSAIQSAGMISDRSINLVYFIHQIGNWMNDIGFGGIVRDDKTFFHIFESIGLVTVFLDPEGQVSYVNPSMVSLSGYSPDELSGKSWFRDIIHGVSEESAAEFLKGIKTGTPGEKIKLPLRKKYGEIRYFNWHYTLVRDDKDVVTGIACIGEDLTERIESEEDLNEKVQHYQKLFNQAVDAIFVHDINGKIIEVNNQSCESLGYTKEELENMSVKDIEIDLDPDTAKEDWIKMGPGMSATITGCQKRKDGTTFPVEVRLGCSIWKGQKIFMALVHSIEDRLKIESELKTLNERISAATAAAQVGIWDWDIKNNHLTWDDQMYRLYGMERNSSMVGPYETWINSLHPEDRLLSDQQSKMALSAEKEYDTEFRLVWPDNSLHHIKASGKVFRDSHGDPVRMVGVNYDITDLKMKEYEIKEASDFLVKLFHLGPVAKTLQRISDNRIVDINKATEQLFGYKHDEVVGKESETIDYWVDPRERKLRFEQLLREGVMMDFEFQFKSRSGETGWASCYAEIIERKGEKYILAEFVNITRRKQAEDALRISNENFITVFNLNPTALAITSAKSGEIHQVNNAYTELMGYSAYEVIGHKPSDFNLYPNDTGRDNLDSRLKQPEHIRNHELQIRTATGQIRIINLSMDRFQFNGETCHLNAFVDITDQKKAEEALIEHRDHLEDLVNKRTRELEKYMAETMDLYENAPCGYHSIDNEGRVIRINNTELSWLGYERQEVVGRKITEFMTPSSREIFGLNFPRFLEKGEITDLDLELIRKNGSTFFISLNGAAIYDNQHNYLFSRSTLFDVSDRKRAEEALNNAKREAEEANRAKSEFLANMSHEIRTPMNAVLGYTDLLGSSVKDPVQKNYLASIKSSGKSLLTLINDILDLSKVEAGKLLLEYDYISTFSFFREFESIFSLKVAEKKLSFSIEIDPEMPEGLYIDEARLRQVVFNLIGNAIKFTREGFITLKVNFSYTERKTESPEAEERLVDLVIVVQDTGIGILEENQKNIFEPFVQEREYKKYGGTGLGLSISKKLVELMKGSISLRSKPGQGSTFTIFIPGIRYITELSRSTNKLLVDPSKVVFERSTLLVVDDVKHNRDFIRDSLIDTELQILEAENGQEAYGIAVENSPDLIITDIRMPNGGGFELLEKLKRDPQLRQIPVIAYSAEVLETQKDRIRESEFSGLLVKPLKVNDLYIELMNWLPNKVIKTDERTGTAFEAGKADEIVNLPELINCLETDLYSEWKKYAVRQPIRAIMSFGSQVMQTGMQFHADSITKYGHELIEAAEDFDIEAILKLISRYPDLIEKLKNLQ